MIDAKVIGTGKGYRMLCAATLSIATITLTGCLNKGSLIDAGASQLEIPSVENQLNRVMVGMSTIRINNAIANMALSSDAQWPAMLDADMSDGERKTVESLLSRDPYVATHTLTDPLQEQHLGGFAWATPRISEITVNAANKVRILYGENQDHWPELFDISGDFSTFHQFVEGKPKAIEALSGNIYENYSAAVIALMPVNYQKDLEELHVEMTRAYEEVALAEAEKGKYENLLESGLDENGQSLSDSRREELKMLIETADVDVDAKKSTADERETIYLTKLDEAVEVLKSDINLDENNVNLAKNIALVSGAIKSGAMEAGTAFGVALTNLTIKGSLQNFPKEEASLIAGKVLVPANKQELIDKRIARLTTNMIYALPAVGIGSYYAVKQAFMAGKYESIAETILDADQAKKELQQEQLAKRQAAAN